MKATKPRLARYTVLSQQQRSRIQAQIGGDRAEWSGDTVVLLGGDRVEWPGDAGVCVRVSECLYVHVEV